MLMTSADGAARGLIASVIGAACVLLMSGAATLVTQAGLGQRVNALWMSALALTTMALVPLSMSRISRGHGTLATAATLIATMSAMGAVPAYMNGLEHRTATFGLVMLVGGVLLICGWRLSGAPALLTDNFDRSKDANKNANRPTRALQTTGSTMLLAWFAGLSSGSLARFQLYAICGVSGVQPLWQIVFSVGAVCAVALIADRSGNIKRTLIVLYVLRAVLIGALAAVDGPTLALHAGKMFLVLDCLTIPALMKLRGKSRSAMSAGCPGVAHHIGMVMGATLSMTPYFFGDGFMVLYVLSAIANVICAGTLAANWLDRSAILEHPTHPPHRPAPSGEREVRAGKYECLVTHAECARARIPDAPLPQLRGGPT
ncbi:hypothetical protein R69888_03088 [Paraburkholderia haematera]|uniref:MFS transporter n=2 Tax=Paraburkholderia haematera TaxID=2793077 RepID=A0ABM8RHQ1_9BURK|nr:hypothetical protein R69888_03088 [Paraburkholderia haematera]